MYTFFKGFIPEGEFDYCANIIKAREKSSRNARYENFPKSLFLNGGCYFNFIGFFCQVLQLCGSPFTTFKTRNAIIVDMIDFSLIF